jgi:hypothetical protein
MADLHSWIQLSERTVLSAPRKAHETHTLNQVILVVSLLSIVGAGWIVLSFCVSIGIAHFHLIASLQSI